MGSNEHIWLWDSQSVSMLTLPPLSLQNRDCTGLEMTKSASTVYPWIRGESLINDTVSGGTTAGTGEREGRREGERER